MRKFKHLLIIISFFSLCSFVIIASYIYSDDYVEFDFQLSETASDESQNSDESIFFDSRYYIVRGDGPFLFNHSDQLIMDNRLGETYSTNPRGLVFSSKGDPVHYESKEGIFYSKQEKILLEQEVYLELQDSKLWGDMVEYDLVPNIIISKGNVRTETYNPETRDFMNINSQEVTVWPERSESEYVQRVNGKITRHRAYEETVYFKSHRLFMELEKQLITLTQDVEITKEEMNATSIRGEIHLENYNKNLKYFVLYDDVKLEEQIVLRGEPIVRQAFAEKLEGIVSEELIILTGYPKVYQKSDVIKGNRIVLRENNEVIEVDDAQTQFIIR